MRYTISEWMFNPPKEVDIERSNIPKYRPRLLEDDETKALFRMIFEEGIRAGQEHADEEDIWKQLIETL